MTSVRDLLIEIGTEELPPKALPDLIKAFAHGVTEGLARAELQHGDVTPYAAPRRLALWLRNVPTRQQDRASERRGPALAAAFDEDGCPSKAAQGFAKSCGVSVEQLEKLETDKGAWLVHRTTETGRAAAELIPDIVRQALAKLPVPRLMRWGAGDTEFVRPVHWIVLLFGNEIVAADILGIATGRETRGHRFHHPQPLYLSEPAAYAPLLETEGHVIADFAVRRNAITAQVKAAAHAAGGEAVITDALLDEVTALVEWPVALLGTFDASFLMIPGEALMSSMMQHQKCFPVIDPKGRRESGGYVKPFFVAVSNLDSKDPEQVRAGNERVIRPRLTDAKFFFEQDGKIALGDRIDELKRVVFQARLGTLHDKAQRISRLAGDIAAQLGDERKTAERAGWLCKCDLLTAMVGEFPELQGIMGGYYADLHEDKAVAAAIREHYMPIGAGAELPQSVAGQAVALADKIDTLVGIFAIGQPPTGAKDPFALRRAALGVLRIMIEQERDLDLAALIDDAANNLDDQGVKVAAETRTAVFDFMLERLRAYYQDANIPADVINAVLARRPPRPLDFDRRVRAVSIFRTLPEAESLAAANKRIGNILRKAEEAGEAVGTKIESARLQDEAEKNLHTAVQQLRLKVDPRLDEGEYTEALRQLAQLRAPVDRFFDDVMVMTDDPGLRANRLALLRGLQDLFLRTADLSRLMN